MMVRTALPPGAGLTGWSQVLPTCGDGARFSMYCVCTLQNREGKFYIGQTDPLPGRLGK